MNLGVKSAISPLPMNLERESLVISNLRKVGFRGSMGEIFRRILSPFREKKAGRVQANWPG